MGDDSYVCRTYRGKTGRRDLYCLPILNRVEEFVKELKFAMPKFFFGRPLILSDFIAVEISLRWSEKPVSNVLENLKNDP